MADVGRPLEYNEDLTPKLARALAKQGLTNEEIAKELGIAERTFYAWKAQYPLFSQAVLDGGASVNDRVKNALLKRALGYDLELKKEVVVNGQLLPAVYDVHIEPDVGAALQWLKNRVPDEWRDKQPESTANDGGLKIILTNASDMDMSNCEIHIPVVPTKTPE